MPLIGLILAGGAAIGLGAGTYKAGQETGEGIKTALVIAAIAGAAYVAVQAAK
jgi:hypothetical protein